MPMPMLFFPPTSDLMAAAATAGGGEGGGDSMGAMDGILLGTAAMLPRPSAIEKQQQQIPQFLQQQLFAMEQQLQHNNNNNPNSHHHPLLPPLPLHVPPPPLPLPLPCSFPSSILPMPVSSSSSSFIPIFNQLIEPPPPPPPLSFSLINENQQKLANSIENGFVDSMATALNPPSFQTPLQNANASAGTNPILLPMSSSSCEQSRLPPPSSPSQQSQMGLLNLNDGNGHGNGNGPSSLPLSSLVNSTLAGPLLAQLGDGGAIEVPSQMAMPPTGPCGFCGMEILDKNFLLIDAQSWHLNCVRCSACGQNLEELGPTCFAKDGLLYCRRDYLIKFGKRCERCSIPIERGEMVMRVPRGGPTSPIPDDMAFFHVHCFTCICCGQLLSSGEQFTVGQFHQFGLAGGGPLFCKVHFHWNLPSCQSASSMSVQPSQIHLLTCPPPYEGGGNTEEPRSLTELNPSASLQIQKEQPQPSQQSQQPPQPITTTLSSQGCHHPSPMPRAFSRSGFDGDKENPPPPNMITTTTTTTAVMADQQRIVGRQESLTPTNGANPSPDDYNYSNGDPYGGSSSSQKQKRMRTSFKHHQLRTMKTYFSLNHNPDAKDLKQLAQKTGLTKRVLQVWFQNARAKFRRNHQHKMGSLGGIMLDHQHQHGQHPHLLLQMATTLGGNGTSVPFPTIDSNGGFQENSLMMIGGGGGGEMFDQQQQQSATEMTAPAAITNGSGNASSNPKATSLSPADCHSSLGCCSSSISLNAGGSSADEQSSENSFNWVEKQQDNC